MTAPLFPSATRHRPAQARRLRSGVPPAPLPAEVEAVVWRGSDLGGRRGRVVPSGFAALDRLLPGGGWPCQSLSEVLSAQPSVLEWRLLGPALRTVTAGGGCVAVVGPPKTPHLPGLAHAGIDAGRLVWIRADSPAERLWSLEQLIKANACGALVGWLPQARPEQIRRLQVCAQACDGPVFLFRPAAARHEASAAPLRVLVSFGLDWELQLQVLKRRGPCHDGVLPLPSVPGGLAAVLTPRLQQPSRLLALREVAANAAVGSPVVPARRQPTPS